MLNEKSEEIKNILCENAEQNLEKYKDFHFGEFVEKPNQCGYFERNGNWYTYIIDERNICTFTGPFSGNGVIYACSKILHISKQFKEYKFTEHELEIYINNNFHSFGEIDKMIQQNERLEKQLDFIREIDKEKEIFRQTYLADASRKENDAEHAWHMAIMTMLLSEYSNEKIDVLKTVGMLLIHDIVEIDAGDTYAYDDAGKATQHEREQKAAERIYGLLPEEQGKPLLELWEEFEEQKTPEAKFARTMDNIQPMLLNDASEGLSWREHGVKLSQILKRNERTAQGSQRIWDYALNNILKKNVENGNIIDDEGVFFTDSDK